MSGTVYLDASALVKLVLAEAESEALFESLTLWQQHVSSELSVVEVLRATRRASVEPAPLERARAVLAALHLIRTDNDLLERAALLEPRTLRALDALHLAAALTLGKELDAMIVYDTSLSAAARAAGLAVVAPG